MPKGIDRVHSYDRVKIIRKGPTPDGTNGPVILIGVSPAQPYPSHRLPLTRNIVGLSKLCTSSIQYLDTPRSGQVGHHIKRAVNDRQLCK